MAAMSWVLTAVILVMAVVGPVLVDRWWRRRAPRTRDLPVDHPIVLSYRELMQAAQAVARAGRGDGDLAAAVTALVRLVEAADPLWQPNVVEHARQAVAVGRRWVQADDMVSRREAAVYVDRLERLLWAVLHELGIGGYRARERPDHRRGTVYHMFGEPPGRTA